MVTSRESNNYDPSEHIPDSAAVQSPELEPVSGVESDPGAEQGSYRDFCLERLSGLLGRRGERLGATARERAFNQGLIDRALYSAYHDCVASGAKEEADQLIKSVAEKS